MTALQLPVLLYAGLLSLSLPFILVFLLFSAVLNNIKALLQLFIVVDMKTLSKPEIILPLMILVGYALCFFFNVHFFSFVHVNTGDQFAIYFKTYKTHFFIAAVAVIIFLGIKLYKAKVSVIQEQYLNLFEGNPMPMTIVDLKTQKFVAANKAAINIYGYSRKEFLNLSVSDIRVKEELDLMYQDLKTKNHGLKKAGIRHHRKKNREVILVEVSSSEVIFKSKKCRLFLARDVTEIIKAREEKKAVEEEIVKQQSFTSYILENFPVDVAIFDKNHRYLFLNKTAVKDEEMRKWMIGKDDFDYVRRKGMDISIAEKRRERFLSAISGESREWIDEYVVDGQPKFLLRKFYPYYENGELKYVYGYGINITEVKNAQIQRDVHLEQLEKIAFTTSHRIRQPICNLQGLITIVEEDQPESTDLHKIVNCMKQSVTAMDDYTRELGMKLHEYKQNLSKADGPH